MREAALCLLLMTGAFRGWLVQPNSSAAASSSDSDRLCVHTPEAFLLLPSSALIDSAAAADACAAAGAADSAGAAAAAAAWAPLTRVLSNKPLWLAAAALLATVEVAAAEGIEVPASLLLALLDTTAAALCATGGWLELERLLEVALGVLLLRATGLLLLLGPARVLA